MSGLNEPIGLQLSQEIQADRRREAGCFRTAREACAHHPGLVLRWRCRMLVCLGRGLVYLGRRLEAFAHAPISIADDRPKNIPGDALL